jgi:hypothetical protein
MTCHLIGQKVKSEISLPRIYADRYAFPTGWAPMLIEESIKKEAAEIAVREGQHAEYLHEEYLSLRAQTYQIKSIRDTARAATGRLSSFRIKIGTGYSCPACWIIRNNSTIIVQRFIWSQHIYT